MFQEHRELVSQLKTSDPQLARVFDQHDALDERIRDMECRVVPATHAEIETLKKEKLRLKDQAYALLKKAGAPV
jgi:uncharacterized protein YdcH (DUF465 family)